MQPLSRIRSWALVELVIVAVEALNVIVKLSSNGWLPIPDYHGAIGSLQCMGPHNLRTLFRVVGDYLVLIKAYQSQGSVRVQAGL